MLKDPQPECLHAATPEEFLPPTSWWTILGGLVLLVTFGAVVILAGILTYHVTVKAPAIVRPAGELRIVQAATEGTVKRIEVEANQDVKEGDIIASVDDSRHLTTKSQLQGNIQQATQQLRQLRAQIQAMDWQIDAETDLLHRTLAAAAAELSLNQRRYRDKRIITTAEMHEAEAAFDLARDELDSYSELVREGVIPQLHLKEKEAALKTAKARLQRVRAALNPSNAEVKMAQEKITQERAKGEAVLAGLRQERERLIQQQVAIQNQLSSDRDALQQIVTDIQRTLIRAPISGTIQQLHLRNQGQVVHPGELIARIAPGNAHLEIKAFVASQDIGKIDIGHTVHVRVSACPYPDYGTLKGTVSAISPDAMVSHDGETDLTQPRGGQETHIAYNVTIQPGHLALRAFGQECLLQPGMEGRAEILSREETILSFLLRKARLVTEL